MLEEILDKKQYLHTLTNHELSKDNMFNDQTGTQITSRQPRKPRAENHTDHE